MSDSIHGLVKSAVARLEAHNHARAGHAERTASYAVATAHRLGIREAELVAVRVAAALHDVGRLLLPRELLERAAPLSEAELNQVRASALLGAETILKLGFESGHDFQLASDAVAHQYARLDVSPPISKVIHVCCAFDVMINRQPWREPVTEQEALNELLRCTGTQFDRATVDAFQQIQPLIQPVDASHGRA